MNFLNDQTVATNDARRALALGKWARVPAPSRATQFQRYVGIAQLPLPSYTVTVPVLIVCTLKVTAGLSVLVEANSWSWHSETRLSVIRV